MYHPSVLPPINYAIIFSVIFSLSPVVPSPSLPSRTASIFTLPPPDHHPPLNPFTPTLTFLPLRLIFPPPQPLSYSPPYPLKVRGQDDKGKFKAGHQVCHATTTTPSHPSHTHPLTPLLTHIPSNTPSHTPFQHLIIHLLLPAN